MMFAYNLTWPDALTLIVFFGTVAYCVLMLKKDGGKE